MIQGYRDLGVQGFRDIGVEFLAVRVVRLMQGSQPVVSTAGIQGYRNSGIQKFRDIGIQRFRDIGI